MKKYLEVRGRGVIDARGNLKGEVLDFIIDVKSKRVCSYILSTKSVFSHPAVISLSGVKSYGDFMVYGGNINRIRRRVLHRNKTVLGKVYMGREIIDSRGRACGRLIDFIYDENTGFIKAFISSRGFFEDIFDGRRLIIVNNRTMLENERIIVEESSIDMINKAFFNKLLE